MLKLLTIKTVVFSLLLFGFAAAAAVSARAQRGGVDVGINYNYVRANAPPGSCGCFALNGEINFSHSIGIVGEIASQHASNVSGSGSDLTLTSYLVGPRYTWEHARHFAPFAQVLLGGAHASGNMAPGNSGLPGSANAFSMIAGGGVDISLTRRICSASI